MAAALPIPAAVSKKSGRRYFTPEQKRIIIDQDAALSGRAHVEWLEANHLDTARISRWRRELKANPVVASKKPPLPPKLAKHPVTLEDAIAALEVRYDILGEVINILKSVRETQ